MISNYIYPPRADVKISPITNLASFEYDYVGQPKMNGSCCVVVYESADMTAYNRHRELLTNTDREEIARMKELYRGEGSMVLCGEYLNKNQAGADGEKFNHRFVVWDILQYQGVKLVGETVQDRLDLLNELYGARPSLKQQYLYHCGDCFRVQSFINNFNQLYKELSSIEVVEGFVLKRLNAKLKPGIGERNNTDWQVKVRKATKNYRF